MSENISNSKLSKENKLAKISCLEDSIFNSKLFLDLDSTYEHSLNSSLEDESDNSNEIDDINSECFLIKELIEEIDSPKSNSFIEDNSVNNSKSISTLADNGYKFLPKKYRNSTNKINNKKKAKFNKFNNIFNNNYYHTKNKNLIEKNGDWFCPLCNNLNFAFRIKCNRCNVLKKECIKK